MSGVDLMSTMFAGTFSFDIEAYTQQLEQKVVKLREPTARASARLRRMPSAF